MKVIPGKYMHYKGGIYEVLVVARHTETEKEHVVYQALYGEKGFWLRPLDMFVETVEMEGAIVPRFKRLETGEG